jgi:hypothetical protein
MDTSRVVRTAEDIAAALVPEAFCVRCRFPVLIEDAITRGDDYAWSCSNARCRHWNDREGTGDMGQPDWVVDSAAQTIFYCLVCGADVQLEELGTNAQVDYAWSCSNTLCYHADRHTLADVLNPPVWVWSAEERDAFNPAAIWADIVHAVGYHQHYLDELGPCLPHPLLDGMARQHARALTRLQDLEAE